MVMSPLATCFLLPYTVNHLHIFEPFFYLLLHLTNFLAWAIPHHVMPSNLLLTDPQLPCCWLWAFCTVIRLLD